jgi:hypothetical protein
MKHHVYMALQLYPNIFGKQYKGLSPDQLKSLSCWNELNQTVKSSGNPYDIAKMVIHASNYGIGPGELSDRVLDKSNGKLHLTLGESKTALDTFNKSFPEIPEWQGLVIKSVKQYRELRNLFGFPRKFEGQFYDRYFKEALSFIPQSTVGTLNNVVFTAMQYKIEDSNLAWNLLINLHDSICLEVPVKEKEQATEDLCNLYRMHRFKGWDGTEFSMEVEVQS